MIKCSTNLLVTISLICYSISTLAQDEYTRLVDKTSVEISDSREELQAAFAALETAEEELIVAKEKLEEYGFDAVTYLKKIEMHFAALSDVERTKVLSGAISEEDLTGSENLQKLNNLIKTGDIQVGDFFKKLDTHIQRVLDVAMALGFQSVFDYLRTADLSPSQEFKVEKNDC